jgi:hypothetical protein
VSLLTEDERARLVEELRIWLTASMFGDGQEDDYVMEGFPPFKGLENMTDDELLLEYGHYNLERDDTPEKRADALRREWADDV